MQLSGVLGGVGGAAGAGGTGGAGELLNQQHLITKSAKSISV